MAGPQMIRPTLSIFLAREHCHITFLRTWLRTFWNIRRNCIEIAERKNINLKGWVYPLNFKLTHYPGDPVSCFYRAAGIYSDFALKRVARRGGRKPTFLLGRLECNVNRLGSGSLSGGFRKDPRRCRAGGAFGRPGNR